MQHRECVPDCVIVGSVGAVICVHPPIVAALHVSSHRLAHHARTGCAPQETGLDRAAGSLTIPSESCQLVHRTYLLYRMATYGDYNPKLTRAISRVAQDTAQIRFAKHARDAMADDEFDDMDVLVCLRKGKAYGPEPRDGDVRGNVIHRGTHIRVVVGAFKPATGDWGLLASFTVITVVRQN